MLWRLFNNDFWLNSFSGTKYKNTTLPMQQVGPLTKAHHLHPLLVVLPKATLHCLIPNWTPVPSPHSRV